MFKYKWIHCYYICSRLNVTCTHDFLIAVQEHCVDCRSGVQAEPKRDCTACQKCWVQSQGTVRRSARTCRTDFLTMTESINYNYTSHVCIHVSWSFCVCLCSVLLLWSWGYETHGPLHSCSAQARWCALEPRGELLSIYFWRDSLLVNELLFAPCKIVF